mmetsp:Transcript_7534/g.11269  ORF Transcript_7534/g.11269 Transcript_7534/m.11269 type:complete len:293 (-) Transcript_7534:228-1106(-)
MPSGIDREIDILLHKLNKILNETGGGTREIELGSSNNSKEDKFNVLKSNIMARLIETCNLMEKSSNGNGGMLSSADPKTVIKRNQDIRSNLKLLESEWTELDAIFQTERSKRRSKMSQDELNERRQMLVDMKTEIFELKSLNQKATVGASVSVGPSAFASLPMSANMNNPSQQGSDLVAAKLTSEQHARILQIKERSKEMEELYLTKIEGHIDNLADLARGMNEELVLQDRMFDDLGDRLEKTNDNLVNVNARMKDTLKKVRAADKFCVDVMCVLLLLGLVAVLYAVIRIGG